MLSLKSAALVSDVKALSSAATYCIAIASFADTRCSSHSVNATSVSTSNARFCVGTF